MVQAGVISKERGATTDGNVSGAQENTLKLEIKIPSQRWE